MKLITRNTDYAIRALCFMAQAETKIVSVSALVQALRIPYPFLRKILQVLTRKGILKSRRGQAGGFEAALPPEKIYLFEVIEIFQGPVTLSECLFKSAICPERKRCPLRKKIESLEEIVFSNLKATTIADLIDQGEGLWFKEKSSKSRKSSATAAVSASPTALKGQSRSSTTRPA